MDFCYNCISPPKCYLIDNDKPLGWCHECGVCGECNELIQYQIEWKVKCCDDSEIFHFTKNVCEQHAEMPNDCTCSKSAFDFKKKRYQWF